ncbi:MAG TPA: hypothetical protein DD420_04925 [Streptomyces sp.]|nr:hypothetical protein [Armatimonadota bacterium]HBF79286.1 hypothetical protein [Streptomyces sp.]
MVQALLYTFLAAWFGLSLLPQDSEQLEVALAEQTQAARAQVTLVPAARGRVGDQSLLRLELDNVEVRRLPLETLLVVPAPRRIKARLDRLEVSLRQAHLEGVTAERIDFVSEDLRYDLLRAGLRQEVRISSAASQRVEVLIRDGGLDALAATTFPELRETHITFEDDRLVAEAQASLILVSFPVRLSGRVQIRDGSKISLVDADLDTGRLELSETMTNTILGRLDPLLDLEASLGFPLPVTWNEVKLTTGQMLLRGEVQDIDVSPDEPEFRPRRHYERIVLR